MKLLLALFALCAAAPPAAEGTKICAETTCSFKDGQTSVIEKKPFSEHWHCEKSGLSCTCLCHESYRCTIRHSIKSGAKISRDHCNTD